jgi:hemolysin-activating ACP:hemolysin acyltransferase
MWGKRKSNNEEDVPAAGGTPTPSQATLAKDDLPGNQSAAGSDAKPKSNGAEPSVANGVDGAESAAIPNRPGQGPTADEIKFAVTFTRVVSVLTRSPHYKHYTLSDLEWLVVPPMLSSQCAVMEAKVNDRQMPVAMVLWASVSEDVDKRLSENLTTPFRLRPDEWRSGDRVWVIAAEGDAKGIPVLLRQLKTTILRSCNVKMRTLGADRRPTVSLLEFAHTE